MSALKSARFAACVAVLMLTGTSNASGDADVRAAAEPFEKLAETAFTASRATLDKTFSEADAPAKRVRTLLSDQAGQELDTQLSALNAALRKQDRATVALASIEVYRVLVSSVTERAKVPTEVNLLDYAGFRYNADLKAVPTRWSDMAEAVSVAKQQWKALAPRVKSPDLEAKVSKALAAMEQAVEHKDKSGAARSVKAELDLVDQLEKHFASH